MVIFFLWILYCLFNSNLFEFKLIWKIWFLLSVIINLIKYRIDLWLNASFLKMWILKRPWKGGRHLWEPLRTSHRELITRQITNSKKILHSFLTSLEHTFQHTNSEQWKFSLKPTLCFRVDQSTCTISHRLKLYLQVKLLARFPG